MLISFIIFIIVEKNKFSLSNNQIGDAGMIAIAQALVGNTTLTSLMFVVC
jgi:hypothetical protein